jgi:hypothetical protein
MKPRLWSGRPFCIAVLNRSHRDMFELSRYTFQNPVSRPTVCPKSALSAPWSVRHVATPTCCWRDGTTNQHCQILKLRRMRRKIVNRKTYRHGLARLAPSEFSHELAVVGAVGVESEGPSCCDSERPEQRRKFKTTCNHVVFVSEVVIMDRQAHKTNKTETATNDRKDMLVNSRRFDNLSLNHNDVVKIIIIKTQMSGREPHEL